MTLAPLIAAPFAVQIHAAAIIPAFFIGTWQIFASRKGMHAHRVVGYFFLALIAIASIAALFIHQLNPNGPFGLSWIHLFVLVTLVGVVRALSAAWNHNIGQHKRAMIGTYIGGLLIAGSFAFVPGRIMHDVLFR